MNRLTGPTGAVRFAAIPIGTYTVTFTLQGFTSVRHDAVRVGIGETRSMDVVFTPALAETVTVVADTVAVDTKRLTNERNFDLEFLQDIPSARDPWDVMEKAPGLDISTVNVRTCCRRRIPGAEIGLHPLPRGLALS